MKALLIKYELETYFAPFIGFVTKQILIFALASMHGKSRDLKTNILKGK